MTTERNIVEALVFACSQDPAVLKVGENYLKECETQPGFYTTLAVSPFRRYISVAYILYCNFWNFRRRSWLTAAWMYRFVGWPLLTSRTESIAIGAQEHQSTCETHDVCAVLFVYQSVCCYSAIDEDEKAFVRRTLLENVEEPVQQVNFLLFPFNFLLPFFFAALWRVLGISFRCPLNWWHWSPG